MAVSRLRLFLHTRVGLNLLSLLRGRGLLLQNRLCGLRRRPIILPGLAVPLGRLLRCGGGLRSGLRRLLPGRVLAGRILPGLRRGDRRLNRLRGGGRFGDMLQ